jgi:hypothetical protein
MKDAFVVDVVVEIYSKGSRLESKIAYKKSVSLPFVPRKDDHLFLDGIADGFQPPHGICKVVRVSYCEVRGKVRGFYPSRGIQVKCVTRCDNCDFDVFPETLRRYHDKAKDAEWQVAYYEFNDWLNNQEFDDLVLHQIMSGHGYLLDDDDEESNNYRWGPENLDGDIIGE